MVHNGTVVGLYWKEQVFPLLLLYSICLLLLYNIIIGVGMGMDMHPFSFPVLSRDIYPFFSCSLFRGFRS